MRCGRLTRVSFLKPTVTPEYLRFDHAPAHLTQAPRPPSDPLERQLSRLANFITKAENLLVSMQSTLRNVSVGGGGYAARRRGPVDKDEQKSVLAEIFKSNVALLQSLEIGGVGEAPPPPSPGADAVPDGGGEPAPAPEPAAAAGAPPA